MQRIVEKNNNKNSGSYGDNGKAIDARFHRVTVFHFRSCGAFTNLCCRGALPLDILGTRGKHIFFSYPGHEDRNDMRNDTLL